ncbi:UNVERIFIED_CONTAM: hypothetical protein GTU68_012979 [Idotea baltica]|nr:hypothetical protein [Idotea baltica]
MNVGYVESKLVRT